MGAIWALCLSPGSDSELCSGHWIAVSGAPRCHESQGAGPPQGLPGTGCGCTWVRVGCVTRKEVRADCSLPGAPRVGETVALGVAVVRGRGSRRARGAAEPAPTGPVLGPSTDSCGCDPCWRQPGLASSGTPSSGLWVSKRQHGGLLFYLSSDGFSDPGGARLGHLTACPRLFFSRSQWAVWAGPAGLKSLDCTSLTPQGAISKEVTRFNHRLPPPLRGACRAGIQSCAGEDGSRAVRLQPTRVGRPWTQGPD